MHPSSSSSSSSFSFTRFYFYSFFFVFSSTDTSGRVCSVGDETKNGKFKKTAAVETWSQRGGPDEWPIQNRNDFEKERERQYRTDIRKTEEKTSERRRLDRVYRVLPSFFFQKQNRIVEKVPSNGGRRWQKREGNRRKERNRVETKLTENRITEFYRVLPSFTECFSTPEKNKDVGTAGAQSILFSNFNLRRKVKEKKRRKGSMG